MLEFLEVKVRVNVLKLFGGFIFILFNFILLMGLVSAMSHPTMFEVNSTEDATDAQPGDGVCETAQGNGICTLRAAIQESNALAGENHITVPASTYTLMIGGVLEDESAFGDLDITDDLILTGDGADNTIIDGNALDRVFHIANENAVVQMSWLTIRNGDIPFDRGGGGGVYNEGTFQLSHSTITSNKVKNEGGGLSNIGSLTLNDTIVTENRGGYGGGVYNAGTIQISSSSVSQNVANYGAGFYNQASSGTPYESEQRSIMSEGTPEPANQEAMIHSSNVTKRLTPFVTPTTTPTHAPGPSPTAVSGSVSALIENSVIIENRGVGIYNSSMLDVNNSEIKDNKGAGIYNLSTLNLNHSKIRGNSGYGLTNETGESYFNESYCVVISKYSIVSNNGNSGLFNNPNCQLTLNHSTVSGNHGYRGGGIRNQGKLTLNNSLVTANHAFTYGGGISNLDKQSWYHEQSLLIINKSVVSHNITNGNGGGIYSNSRLAVIESTISNNETHQHGGGIYSNTNESVRLSNSTVSGNQANLSGGGIYHAGKDAMLSLSSVTISNNTADSDGNESGDGGGLFNFIGAVNIQNTIIAANYDYSPTTQRADCSSLSVINSLGYNLMTQNLASCPVGGDTTGNLIDVEPNLGPLQDNGGSTFTHALLAGSPALDAGNPAGCADQNGALLNNDQVGLPRTLDGNADGSARCDIGAYELSLTPITPVPFTPVPSAPATNTPILATVTNTPVYFSTPTHAVTHTSTRTPIATLMPESVTDLLYLPLIVKVSNPDLTLTPTVIPTVTPTVTSTLIPGYPGPNTGE